MPDTRRQSPGPQPAPAVRLEVVRDAEGPPRDYLPALVTLLRRLRDRERRRTPAVGGRQ